MPASGEVDALEMLQDAPLAGPAASVEVECPFCSEKILAKAKKCRFCGEMLDPTLRDRAQRPSRSHVTVVAAEQKSATLAFILALFFGPLGMLYATVQGAITIFLIDVITFLPTAGVVPILTIPIGAVWAAMAVSESNKRVLEQLADRR